MTESAAQRRANERYKATRDIIRIQVPKGRKDVYSAAARRNGQSLTAYIIDAIEARLAEDA